MTAEKLDKALRMVNRRIKIRQKASLILLLLTLIILLLVMTASINSQLGLLAAIGLLIIALAAVGTVGEVLHSQRFTTVRMEALERLTHSEELERENRELFIAIEWLFEELNHTNWDGLRNLEHDAGRISGAVKAWALTQVRLRGQYDRLNNYYDHRR
jgi:hypothetical protein